MEESTDRMWEKSKFMKNNLCEVACDGVTSNLTNIIIVLLQAIDNSKFESLAQCKTLLINYYLRIWKSPNELQTGSATGIFSSVP
jgi:hypothetical protein